MSLTCPKCGLEQSEMEANVTTKPLPQGGSHRIARCNNCNSYIKNIPHSSVSMLWFGKYKGKPIVTVAKEDPKYLGWLLSTNPKDKLKQAIKLALKT